MNTPTPYNRTALCNDIESLLEQNSLQSKYLNADIKTVNIRVNQLMRNNAYAMAQWNYAVALINRSDYPSSEAQQLRVGGELQDMVFELYISLPKTDQAGLYLSPETFIFIQYKLNSKK